MSSFFSSILPAGPTQWNLHPDWQGRHDFYDQQPPPDVDRASRRHRTSTVTYEEHMDFTSWWPRRRFYFHESHWIDSDGVSRSVNREDLRSVFDKLLRDWESLLTLQKKLRRVIDLYAPHALVAEKARWAFVQLEDPRAAALGIAKGYGAYLDRLADAEAAMQIPQSWKIFRGAVERSTLGPLARSTWRDINDVDTLAFQLALEVCHNGLDITPPCPELDSLKETARAAYEALLLDYAWIWAFKTAPPRTYEPTFPEARRRADAVLEAEKWGMELPT